MGVCRKQPWMPAALEWCLKAQALAWFCCLFLPSLPACPFPSLPFPPAPALPAHPRAAALPSGTPFLTACHHTGLLTQHSHGHAQVTARTLETPRMP